MSSSPCPTATEQDERTVETMEKDNDTSGLSSIMKAMGIRACKSVQAGGVSIFPPGFVGANVSIGCEKLAVMATKIDQHISVMQCLIQKNSTTSDSTATSTQTIKLILDGITLDGDVSLTNTINGQQVTIAKLEGTFKTEVDNNMNSLVESIRETIQKEDKGAFNGSDGEKVVNSFQQKLKEQLESTQIQESTAAAYNKFTANQEIELTITNSTIRGNIDLDNEFVYRQMGSTVVNSVLSSVFKTKQGADYIENWKVQQESTAQGLVDIGNIGGIIAIGLLVVVVGAMFYLRRSVSKFLKILPLVAIVAGIVFIVLGILSEDDTWSLVQIILGILMIVVGIGFLIYKFISDRRLAREKESAKAMLDAGLTGDVMEVVNETSSDEK